MRNRVRGLRTEREWTQSDLAERLGVTRQTINAIENGRYDPNLRLAFRIGELFELSLEDIFEPNGQH